METTKIDLNRIGFFKPVAGKTLREQLQGKKLASAEVVEYIRSLPEDFVPPSHWGFRLYGFSLLYILNNYVQGFCWADQMIHGGHSRFVTGEVMDVMVGEGWHPSDWVLIEL